MDIYTNSGAVQPECVEPPINEITIKDISDLALFPVDGKTIVWCIKILND